jgi:lipopolysaccharide/colanic/teichoic acid biosynthesis glycosyltransferase
MSNGALALGPTEDELFSQRRFSTSVKRAVDFLLALAGLVLSAPILLAAAVLIKLTSRGPVLYSQIRLGLGGRPFRIYKLRSMYQNCEALSGACWSVKGDPRITPVGHFLRKTHVDELPQLWNILVGDMSLIGPRPERPEMIPGLERAIPHYRRRLLILPGLSGLAQVQLPPDSDLQSVRIKLAYDLCYLENMSLLLDCRILLATIFKVFGVSFDRIRRLCGLPCARLIEERYHPPVRKTRLLSNPQTVLEVA